MFNKIKMIINKNKVNKYKKSIENKRISFSKKLYNKYFYNGIEVQLDFNVCSYNEKLKEFLTVDLVLQFYDMLTRELNKDVLVALKEENIKFYLRDIETIQMEYGYGTNGVYCSEKKEIHIGLNSVKALRKTFFHEIGHFIDHMTCDKDIQSVLENFNSHFDADTRELFEEEVVNCNFREYARTNPQEFIAVAFEVYLSNKSSLNNIPSVKKLMEDYLEKLHLQYFNAIFNFNAYLYEKEELSLEDTVEITEEEYLKQVVC